MPRNTPLDALIYYAECSAATVEQLAYKKSKSASEFSRQILITVQMVLDCYRFIDSLENKSLILTTLENKSLILTKIRLLEALKYHNTNNEKTIPRGHQGRSPEWNDLLKYLLARHQSLRG